MDPATYPLGGIYGGVSPATRPDRHEVVPMMNGYAMTAVVILSAVLATEAAATRASRITVREALTYL